MTGRMKQEVKMFPERIFNAVSSSTIDNIIEQREYHKDKL